MLGVDVFSCVNGFVFFGFGVSDVMLSAWYSSGVVSIGRRNVMDCISYCSNGTTSWSKDSDFSISVSLLFCSFSLSFLFSFSFDVFSNNRFSCFVPRGSGFGIRSPGSMIGAVFFGGNGLGECVGGVALSSGTGIGNGGAVLARFAATAFEGATRMAFILSILLSGICSSAAGLGVGLSPFLRIGGNGRNDDSESNTRPCFSGISSSLSSGSGSGTGVGADVFFFVCGGVSSSYTGFLRMILDQSVILAHPLVV